MAQWLERHQAHKALECRPTTQNNHKDYARHVLAILGAELRIQKIAPYDIRRLHTQLAQKGLSASVRKHIASFLKGALREAVSLELIPKNPCDHVAPPKSPKVVTATAWEPEEVAAFLEFVKREAPWRYPILLTVLTLGLRRGEVLGLKWEDLRENTLSVRRGVVDGRGTAPYLDTPKTPGSVRELKLAPTFTQILEEWRETLKVAAMAAPDWSEQGLMFPSEKGTIQSPRNLSRAFDALLKRSGVREIRFHDMRHTYTTLALQHGLDVKVVSRRLGHTNVAMTLNIYRQITESDQDSAALDLSELLKSR